MNNMKPPKCDLCDRPAKISAMCKDGVHNLCENHVAAFACRHFEYSKGCAICGATKGKCTAESGCPFEEKGGEA